MKLRISIPNLLLFTVLFIGTLSLGTPPAHAGKPNAVDSIVAKLDPHPAMPDSTNNGFAKLVVKNLGPIINSSYDDFAPTITADGSTMFFVSDRKGGLGLHDFWGTESPGSVDTIWNTPIDVTDINSTFADGAASI
ncbi:MAG TPA: hypothetical protein VGM92_14430, partial [Candidatus Kapabacteria bacterium]